jgi:MFS family permease
VARGVGKVKAALKGLPSAVWLLGLMSLLNDAASELVYPLIPLYVGTVLAAGPRALGLIEGAAEAASALLKLVSGVWYDRTGRAKPFIVTGYGLAALARPLIAFVTVWPLLLALRVMDRIGKGLRSSPRDALLARAVDADRRGLAFGVHRAFDNAGAVIGPLLAAALLAAQVPIRDILLWAAVPGGLCVLLAAAVKEAPSVPASAPALAEGQRDWRWRNLPLRFKRVLRAVAIFTLGQASNAFILLRASDAGMAPAQVALLWAAVAATSALLAVPLSAWSDRIGRAPLLIGGWCLYALVFAGFGFAATAATILGLAVAMGVTMAATEGAERALIADLVPHAQLGSAYGWYYLTKGLLLLPASFVFGAVWQAFGAGVAFAATAVLAVVGAAMLWRAVR